MKKIFILAAGCVFFFACNNEKKEDDKKMDDTNKTTMSSGDKKAATELLDVSMGDGVKSSFTAFSKGDIDGMTANYADNILYAWSNGDSLNGKKAVADYYKGRWKLLESLNFDNYIVLPLQVNEPQIPALQKGKWVLHWATAKAKYKNGKTVDFFLHSVNHMNDAGKVDFIRMYYDRHPIMEATKDLMK